MVFSDIWQFVGCIGFVFVAGMFAGAALASWARSMEPEDKDTFHDSSA